MEYKHVSKHQMIVIAQGGPCLRARGRAGWTLDRAMIAPRCQDATQKQRQIARLVPGLLRQVRAHCMPLIVPASWPGPSSCWWLGVGPPNTARKPHAECNCGLDLGASSISAVSTRRAQVPHLGVRVGLRELIDKPEASW